MIRLELNVPNNVRNDIDFFQPFTSKKFEKGLYYNQYFSWWADSRPGNKSLEQKSPQR